MNSPNRRTFLVASALGFAGLRFGMPGPAAMASTPGPKATAKSTILFFLCGGSSHIDMWDLKPEAPIEYRGLFNPIATSAGGVNISELSEMGRTPKVGDRRSGGVYGGGRDHWTRCQSVVFAGGGIRGGQTYGTSDRHAEYPADKPVTPAHIGKTVYRAMGIHNLEAKDPDGREFNLLAEGEPLVSLF